MYYTTWLGWGYPNKTAYSTSTDGASWIPNSGTTNTRLTMQGYPYDWNSADVNGGNVLYYENGVYHLYFIDFTKDGSNHDQPRLGIFHATSSDGVNFTYQNTIYGQKFIVNDLKPFWWLGTVKYYLLITYDLINGADLSVSNSLSSFPTSTPLFTNMDADDRNMLSVGLVASDSRVYGALYGGVAGPPGTVCCTGAIYAKWLQKKVLFINDYVRWGDIERAYGPDRIKLFMFSQDPVETGRFYIYDTDGTTLLYTSPRVTIRSGDIWSYIDPLPPGIAVTPKPALP